MNHIFLIGMPGSGKSTMGRQLARRMDLRFIDLDEEIMREAGKSIPQIFEQDGEEAFRKLERTILHKICSAPDRAVIATGGGAPCFYDNMEYLRRNGQTIFLNVSVPEIARRLSKAGHNERPLLQAAIPTQLEEELRKKFRRRIKFYQKADLTVTEQTSIDRLVMLLRHK